MWLLIDGKIGRVTGSGISFVDMTHRSGILVHDGRNDTELCSGAGADTGLCLGTGTDTGLSSSRIDSGRTVYCKTAKTLFVFGLVR